MYKIYPLVEKEMDNAIPRLGSVITKEGRCIHLRQSFLTQNEAMFSHLKNIFPVKDFALLLFIMHRKTRFLWRDKKWEQTQHGGGVGRKMPFRQKRCKTQF